MCFQLDHEALFTLAKVGPHNLMFYDMIRGQCDRLLCSVQKKKNKEKEKEKCKRKKEKKKEGLQLLSVWKTQKRREPNIQKGQFTIVGADAGTKILLVNGVKLASVVTTSFEHKKHCHITF